jgi:hypothetical protein
VETSVHCKNNPQLTMTSLSTDTSGPLLDQLSPHLRNVTSVLGVRQIRCGTSAGVRTPEAVPCCRYAKERPPSRPRTADFRAEVGGVDGGQSYTPVAKVGAG